MRLFDLNQVSEPSGAVQHALNDDAIAIGGKQDQVALVDCLAETGGEVISPSVGGWVIGDARTDLDRFVDEGNRSRWIVGGNEIANGAEVFQRLRPQPITVHRSSAAAA